MSKVERKEYQETKIMRTVSPMRATRTDPAQFDNNLDNLLEDLQSSVPENRTKTYRETRVVNNVDTGRNNSLNRVTHLKASNPVIEYASDDSYNYAAPDGSNNVRSYKKEMYSYSTTGNGVPPEKHRMQNNINQLDTLLDDLKHVKQSIDLKCFSEYNKSKVMMGKKVVERELHYGDTPPRGRSDREGSMTREIEYLDEGTYGETRPIRYATSPPRNQTSTLTKQKVVSNVQTHPLAVVETTTPDINPEILANLDPNLLPSGNTKVTTTIKTYTYEIPGSGYQPVSPDSEKYVYSPNDSQTTPSKSFVYNKVENKDVVHYPPPQGENWKTENVYRETTSSHSPLYQRPTSPRPSGTTIIKETTRNYQPGYHPDSPPPKQTYVYNETTTTRHVNDGYPNDSNTYENDPNRYPPHDRRPNEPYDPNNVNITYKYTTHSSSAKGYPPHDEAQPLLRPQPFPHDGVDGPPKRVDELMANIGREPPDSPLNAGYTQHEAELIQQKKIESLKQQQQPPVDDVQRKEKNLPPTKNITGPPVYYPPGEMFLKKEESGGWRAEGAMARESGKYKYEAESSSKSKAMGGAAVVPVCLPLCCGLPCTIL
ncbi:hypothetical protein FQR65_LT10360 [Abscondita terminalis]|nr:hypothetical protein FQR65_LT10360 [Abscondita terminalis]